MGHPDALAVERAHNAGLANLLRPGLGSCVAGYRRRHGYGIVHADQQTGVGRDLYVFAFAGHDVDGAACQADAEAADYVAEDGADQRGATGADGGGDGVTFVVVLFLDDSAFFDFHVFAGFRGGLIVAGLFDGDDAHLDGDDAAIDFERAEGEVHVGFAANQGEAARRGDGADDAVDAGAGGNEELVAEVDGFGDDGDEGIAFARCGGADGIQQREMNLGALHDLARFWIRARTMRERL